MPSLPIHGMGRQAKGRKIQSRGSIVLYLALVLCMSWAAYLVFFQSTAPPGISDVGAQMDKATSEYGINAQPAFTDMIQIQTLPSELLPETGKHRHTGKLVVVGDVHGMRDALLDLLQKVKFDEKHDHLILAGDMISKGPDSPGVVDLAMKLGASGIRGNHEDRIILAHADMVAKHAVMDPPGPSEEPEKMEDDLEELSYSHGDYKERALVKLLGEKRIKWLKKCPVILRVGDLGNMGEVVVVHAGLAPGVKLEKQDPSMVMNMRTIGKDGVPSDKHGGTGWMKVCIPLCLKRFDRFADIPHQVWNKYQKSLPKKERTTVIYGHDSKRGLVNKKYSIGIDTGCLKGGKLTAVVIEGGQSDHTHKIVRVGCKDGRNR
jgi:hypothetical protein